MKDKLFWGALLVFLGLVVFAKQGSAAEGRRACFGQCANICILKSGTEPSKRLFCSMKCLGKCFLNQAANANNYCHLGCALDKCINRSSDLKVIKECLEHCSDEVCNKKNQ